MASAQGFASDSQNAQNALIFTMVLMSAADAQMTDSELHMIGELVQSLPVFRGFDTRQVTTVARACGDILQRENGLEEALDIIKNTLPDRLYDTAYALAVDVVAVDRNASQEELRLLEMLEDHLDIDPLHAEAIRHGARCRFRV